MSKLRQARDRKSQALRKVARPVKASAEITLAIATDHDHLGVRIGII